MEIAGGHDNKHIVLFYELIGTAGLLLSINWGENPDNDLAGPLSVAVTVFILIIIAAPISGAHFNPAITLGVLVVNRTG